MAQLRPVEERDAKGNTIRINPAITFKQDRNIRVIVGRHDWRLDDNPNYHPPITAQVQDGKIRFFDGVPDNSQTRSASKELAVADVPQYIIDAIKAHPIRVREPRPTVYEVKLATVGDVEVAQATELGSAADGDSVTVSAVEPNVNPHRQRGGAKTAQATL